MEPINIWITQGRDFEGTRGNQLYRAWLAARAGPYRDAMDPCNQEEKNKLAQEVMNEMTINNAHLFKKKQGVWAEMTGPALTTAIKDALRACTKKRKLANDAALQELVPASPQLSETQTQAYLPPLTPTYSAEEVRQALDTPLPYEVYTSLFNGDRSVDGVSSGPPRRNVDLSQLEESMFNMACTKIQEKQVQLACKPMVCTGTC